MLDRDPWMKVLTYLVLSAGVAMSHMPVSLMTATSAFSASLLSARKAARLGEPISSSPSISAVMAQGGLDAMPEPPDVADAIGIALTGGRRLQGVAP